MIGKQLYIIFFCTILAGITHGQENRPLCESVTIYCACGTGDNLKKVQLKLEANVTEYLENGEVRCFGYPEPHRACANISCSFASNNAEKVVIGKSLISHFYPQEVDILAGGADARFRFKREDEPCQVTPLKNANIKCWKWPNWTKCDIKCINLYALQMEDKSITSMSINCRKTENNWKPAGFIDCLPYVNCNVQLVSPGDLKCKQPADGPAYCDISCHAFEHYEAVKHQRYECVDEEFSRILPHCATLNEFVHLVDKPKQEEEVKMRSTTV